LAQVEEYGKEENERHRTGRDQGARMNALCCDLTTVAAEKPDDLAPTTHEIPQMPAKSC
jgi:hypothetical protein